MCISTLPSDRYVGQGSNLFTLLFNIAMPEVCRVALASVELRLGLS